MWAHECIKQQQRNRRPQLWLVLLFLETDEKWKKNPAWRHWIPKTDSFLWTWHFKYFSSFCCASLPLTSTRWLDQHIQAFPHSKKCCGLISAKSRMNNSSIKFFRKILENAKNRTWGCWMRSTVIHLCYAEKHLFMGSSLLTQSW